MSTSLKTLIIFFVFLSLGLNVFLLGMMLGKKFDNPRNGLKGKPNREELPRKDFESLSKENKSKLNRFMKETRDVFHKHHKEMKRLQKESFDVLIADKFDAKVYKENMLTLFGNEHEMRKGHIKEITQIASSMDKEGRIALARLFKKKFKGRSGHKKRRGEEGHRFKHERNRKDERGEPFRQKENKLNKNRINPKRRPIGKPHHRNRFEESEGGRGINRNRSSKED